jgi:hypothetical protein
LNVSKIVTKVGAGVVGGLLVVPLLGTVAPAVVDVSPQVHVADAAPVAGDPVVDPDGKAV